MKTGKRLVKLLFVAAFITCLTHSMAPAQIPGSVPDLSIWADTWFKVKLSRTVYQFSNIGVKPTPGYPIPQAMGTAYLRIASWDPTPGAEKLIVNVYTKDHNTGQWITTPFATFDVFYFAGSNLKFIGSGEIVVLNDVTLRLVFVFTGKRNNANTNFVMDGTTKLGTTGSSMLEIDDVPGSTERWAGSVKISGPMVPNVPFTPAP